MGSTLLQFELALLVALEAILFGVFGVLYSIYTQYMSSVTESDPKRPKIVDTLIILCERIVLFNWLIVILVFVGLVLSIWWPVVAERSLAIGLGGLMLGLAIIGTKLKTKMGKPVGASRSDTNNA